MANEATLKIVENERANGAKPSPIPSRRTAPQRPVRERPQRVLPTVRIAVGKQLDILRGYAAASGPSAKPVSVDEVADIVKIASSSFSLVNPFFVDVGLIQRIEQKQNETWRYFPAQDVLNFAKAYEWNKETAAQKLAPILASAWFGEALIKRLTFGQLEEKEAITVLAEQASASPSYADELGILLDFLEASGVILRDGATIRLGRQSAAVSAPAESPASGKEPPAQPAAKASTLSTAYVQPTQGVVNFHVDVKINMDEFASWSADRITSFFAGIAQVLAAKAALEKEASRDS